MQKKHVYSWLWDYGLVYEGKLIKKIHVVMMVGLDMDR